MTPEAFLATFFGSGNDIRYTTLEQNNDLRDLASDVLDDLHHPAVLPRRRGERVDWFVLCPDDPSLRQAQGEVQAFVGPSYARWDSVRASLDTADAIEAALLEFVDGRVLRFRTAGDAEFRECWPAVKLMRSVWRQRPGPAYEQPRSGASLVSEFELAIAAGDPSGATSALNELKRRGLLGTENLRFLEIRVLAAEGRWDEIAEARDLPDLAKVRRPWLVTDDLLTALYRSRLARFEAEGEVQAAISALGQLLESAPALFLTRGPLRTPEAIKIFALRRAVPPYRDADAIRRAASEPELSDSDRDWLLAVAETIDRPSPPPRSGRDALAAGDIDAAFALAEAEPASRQRTELLIECAYEIQTLTAAAIAVEALDDLSSEDRASLLERRLLAVAVEQLEGLIAGPKERPTPPPTTWTQWLTRLQDDPDWPAARAVAACGELEYAAEDLEDPDTAASLPDLVIAVAESAHRQVLFDSLPRIVGWVERQDIEPGQARPVHEAILTAVAVDTSRGASTLDVAYNAAEGLLTAGVTEPGYADLLDQLSLIWERMFSRTHTAWLCDVLELLTIHPGPREPLLGFIAGAVGPVLGFARQLDSELLETLGALCDGLGAAALGQQVREAALAAEPAVDVQRDALRGKLVGIYTLTPQVAVRARDAMLRRFPGVRVEIDSSHVSTPALEQLAVAADYLIVSIRSAKHAATDAIDRYRPRDRATLIPRGRGSTRMVEALIQAVESGSPAVSMA